MPRRRITAAEYIDGIDPEMRTILGELSENAARLNLHWANAANLARDDPTHALQELAAAWVALSTAIRIERTDALRRISRASALLEGERSKPGPG